MPTLSWRYFTILTYKIQHNGIENMKILKVLEENPPGFRKITGDFPYHLSIISQKRACQVKLIKEKTPWL